MALATTLSVTLDAVLSKALDLATSSTPAINHYAALTKSLTSGTGAGQADTVFADTRSLTTGQSEDLDLAGSLVNSFGDPAVFAKVRTLLIYASTDNTVNITLFGDAASVPILNTAATTTTLTPGGIFLVHNPTGFAVTATTADIIQAVNGAGNSSYSIIIIGTSV